MASILRTFSRPLLQRSIYPLSAPRFRRLLSDDQGKAQESLPTSQQLQVRASTSLAWVQLYTKCPASFGVGTFNGYYEIISPNSVLPIKKKDILVNALPYVRESDFPVYYRRTPRDVPVLIESINLQGLTLGETEKVHFRVTMGLGQNLIGYLKVEDIENGKVVTMDFDGTAAAHPQRDRIIVV